MRVCSTDTTAAFPLTFYPLIYFCIPMRNYTLIHSYTQPSNPPDYLGGIMIKFMQILDSFLHCLYYSSATWIIFSSFLAALWYSIFIYVALSPLPSNFTHRLKCMHITHSHSRVYTYNSLMLSSDLQIKPPVFTGHITVDIRLVD